MTKFTFETLNCKKKLKILIIISFDLRQTSKFAKIQAENQFFCLLTEKYYEIHIEKLNLIKTNNLNY